MLNQYFSIVALGKIMNDEMKGRRHVDEKHDGHLRRNMSYILSQNATNGRNEVEKPRYHLILRLRLPIS